jgi:hypothetical protein
VYFFKLLLARLNTTQMEIYDVRGAKANVLMAAIEFGKALSHFLDFVLAGNSTRTSKENITPFKGNFWIRQSGNY